MKLRRRTVGVTLVCLLILSAPACHKNLTPATPHAAAAMKADDVVIRVNELQAATIQACWPTGQPAADCAPNTIPVATARAIVKACLDIRAVASSAPDGWLASVRTAWAQAKARIGPVANPTIVAAMSAVDVLLGGLQ